MTTMNSTSYAIVERVRAAISNQFVRASDTEVSRALGITRAAVSAYKSGRSVMGIDTLGRAQELLNLPGLDLARLSIELSMDATKEPAARRVLDALRDSLRGSAASILLASCALFGAAHSPGTSATSGNFGESTAIDRDIHYTCYGRRRRRDGRTPLQRFWSTVFPALDIHAVLAGA